MESLRLRSASACGVCPVGSLWVVWVPPWIGGLGAVPGLVDGQRRGVGRLAGWVPGLRVDVAVDPNEPPMPGKVDYEQAKKFAQAFLKGQPHRAAIATTLFKDRIQRLRS